MRLCNEQGLVVSEEVLDELISFLEPIKLAFFESCLSLSRNSGSLPKENVVHFSALRIFQ